MLLKRTETNAEEGDGEEGKSEGGIRVDMSSTKDNASVDGI